MTSGELPPQQNVSGQGHIVGGGDVHIGSITQHFTGSDFQRISLTTPEELKRTVSQRGFLILTDLVGSTKQTHGLPEATLRDYHRHRIGHIKTRAQRHGLQWLTHAGDADLLFLPGDDGLPLLKFFRDLNDTDPVPDFGPLHPVFRMVAHHHKFTFAVADLSNRMEHLVGSHVTLLFRLEKECPARQLLLTHPARDCLPENLPFDLTASEGFFPIGLQVWTQHVANRLHWLQAPVRTATLLTDLPRRFQERHGEVARQVAHIRIFGGLYEDVRMEQNFLNLLLDNRTAAAATAYAKPPHLNLANNLAVRRALDHEDEKDDEAALDVIHAKSVANRTASRRELKASELHGQFCTGAIIGLPGAGKTTILHYLANALYRAFDVRAEQFRDTLVLLVNCRDVTTSVVQRAQAQGAQPLWWGLAAAFLYPGRPAREDHAQLELLGKKAAQPKAGPAVLTEAEEADIKATADALQRVWKAQSLCLLVDALDEAPGDKVKDFLVRHLLPLAEPLLPPGKALQPVAATSPDPLARRNRLWISLRPTEQHRLDLPRFPRFVVQSLDQDQIRQLARMFWHIPDDWAPRPNESVGEDVRMYRRFDALLPYRSDVHTVAGTPLTALLVIFYYQQKERFGPRYELYHLILLFILLRVWEELKAGRQASGIAPLDGLLRCVGQGDIAEDQPLVAAQYELLAYVSWEGLYAERVGQADESERSLPRATFDLLLQEWQAGHGKTWFQKPAFKAAQAAAGRDFSEWPQIWLEWNLLVPAGQDRFVFIHSTVLEFLAARHLVLAVGEPPRGLPDETRAALRREDRHHLETFPLACSHSRQLGLILLSELKGLLANSLSDSLVAVASRSLPVRCLADLEVNEELELAPRILQRHRERTLQEFRAPEAKDWIYNHLLDCLCEPQPVTVLAHTRRLTGILPLSGDTLRERILADPDRTGYASGHLAEGSDHPRRQFISTLLTRKQLNLLANSKNSSPDQLPLEIIALPHASMSRRDSSKPSAQAAAGVSESVVFKTEPLMGVRSAIGLTKLSFIGHNSHVWACAWSPDGLSILSSSHDHTLRVWDSKSGHQLRALTGHSFPVTTCAWSPDGQRVLSGSRDGTLRLWDPLTGQELRALTDHGANIRACAWSPDSQKVLSASGCSIEIWDAYSGKHLDSLDGHEDEISACAWSGDGHRVLSASMDHSLRIWDLNTGGQLHSLTGHGKAIFSCAWSPDCRRILSGSHDHTLRLWDADSGKELFSLPGLQTHIYACAWSPDGKWIVSGSADPMLCVWWADTRECVHVFHLQTVPLFLAFSPQNPRLLCAANANNTLTVFDLSKEPAIAAHEDQVTKRK